MCLCHSSIYIFVFGLHCIYLFINDFFCCRRLYISILLNLCLVHFYATPIPPQVHNYPSISPSPWPSGCWRPRWGSRGGEGWQLTRKFSTGWMLTAPADSAPTGQRRLKIFRWGTNSLRMIHAHILINSHLWSRHTISVIMSSWLTLLFSILD